MTLAAPGNAVRVMSGDSRYHRPDCRIVGEAIAEAEAIAAAEAAAEAAAQARAEAAARHRFGGRGHAQTGPIPEVVVEKTPALEIEDMTMDAALAEGYGACGFCRPPIPGVGELPEPVRIDHPTSAPEPVAEVAPPAPPAPAHAQPPSPPPVEDVALPAVPRVTRPDTPPPSEPAPPPPFRPTYAKPPPRP